MSQKHKSRKRFRPDIQSEPISKPKNDEYQICKGEDCHNVVARANDSAFCLVCRRK